MTSQITPAGLGFLAIYNPSLSPGSDEDSVDDQIVYFATPSTLSARRRAQRRRRRKRGNSARQRARPAEGVSRGERDERLRQIGLAQGMVEFAGGFAGGRGAVDVVETERGRVLLREVEPGWWILSSVDLTRVPLPPRLPTASSPERPEEAVVEYSARELKPAALLMQDLARAHSLFLLHHDVSLSSLLARLGRRRFVSALARYWDLFLSTWSVCMHGNPIRSVFGGINVAASGELGVGVGEEDRGSGEREVLEGLVGRVDGLVDVAVSKFAEANGGGENSEREKGASGAGGGPSWLGTGRDPEAEDGAVFLGVGALSRRSLRDLAHWVEDLYTWGGNAYGVIGASSYVQGDANGKKPVRKGSDGPAEPPRASSPTTGDGYQAKEGPAQGVKSADSGGAGTAAESPPADMPGSEPAQPEPPGGAVSPNDEEGHMNKFASILKLGYGTYWSLGGDGEAPSDTTPHPPAERDAKDKSVQERPVDESEGYFLIGLKGTVEEHAFSDSEEDSPAESPSLPSTHTRILHVRLSSPESSDAAAKAREGSDDEDGGDQAGPATPLRAVVYVIKPFIFTFLFRPDTPALASDALYRSLHYQLSPLRKPLLLSTSYRPSRPGVARSSSSSEAPSTYDLVFDPAADTTHSTIPNIPAAGGAAAPNPWTRSEAAATHAHLLSLYAARGPRDLEATARTNKGWWIVWSRAGPAAGDLLPSAIAEEDESSDGGCGGGSGGSGAAAPRGRAKEVFLLRRAGDGRARAFSGSGLMGDGSARLGQGIGVDTRGYIEGLLGLGR